MPVAQSTYGGRHTLAATYILTAAQPTSGWPPKLALLQPCAQCRDEWISSLIDELDDTQDAYEHVKHLTDIHRLYLFDAIMQYRAIFFGGGSSVAGATGTGPGGQSQSAATASLLQAGRQTQSGAMASLLLAGSLHVIGMASKQHCNTTAPLFGQAAGCD
eukprot:scaffold75331_cov22-Tisochrysis_lutea.AAC.1